MITLDALLRSHQPWSNVEWHTVSELDLRYDCLLGDIHFRIDHAGFSTEWGWVPVLDFALGLSNLVDSVATTGEESLEFTESEAEIRVRRRADDLLEVTSTYSAGVGAISHEDLYRSSRDFLRKLADRLVVEHPALAENPHFRNALRRERVG